MQLLALVVATALLVSVALIFGVRDWRAQDDFFSALVISAGHGPRQAPPLRFGLGLDEEMVSWRDWAPASKALSQPLSDQRFERMRLRARNARYAEVAALPIVVLLAVVTSTIFSTMWLVPVMGAVVGWGFGWSVAGQSGYWYSRPDLGKADRLTWVGYLIPVALVGGTLALVGLILVVVDALRRS